MVEGTFGHTLFTYWLRPVGFIYSYRDGTLRFTVDPDLKISLSHERADNPSLDTFPLEKTLSLAAKCVKEVNKDIEIAKKLKKEYLEKKEIVFYSYKNIMSPPNSEYYHSIVSCVKSFGKITKTLSKKLKKADTWTFKLEDKAYVESDEIYT